MDFTLCNRRILAIDDKVELLDIYKEMLVKPGSAVISSQLAELAAEDELITPNNADEGFEVTTASQGQAGVNRVAESLRKRRPFAVAFIDIRMPPGIDGLETAKRIRELDDRIIIIMVTAYQDRSAEEIQNILEHDVLLARKPLTGDEVRQQARNGCVRWCADDKLIHHGSKEQAYAKRFDLSQKFLIKTLNAIPEIIILCTGRGRIRFVNQSGCKISGYSEQVLLGKLVDLLFPLTDIRNIIYRVAQNRATPRYEKYLLRNSSGKDLPATVSGSPIFGSDGEVSAVLLSITVQNINWAVIDPS